MGEIYKITNLTNNKCYIGKTKYESTIRWKDHINGYHPSSLIHKAIVKYGLDNFSFEILDYDISEENLDSLEQHYISLFSSKTPNGYNLTDGGDGGKGLVVSEETKLKQSILRRGKPWSENRRKAGQPNLIGNVNAKRTRVAMIGESNTVVQLFDSISDASRVVGVDRKSLRKLCLSGRMDKHGYYWKFI